MVPAATSSDHPQGDHHRMTTDQMIAEKDGAVGRMIFNNPERRNAVSLEMWEAMEDIVADFNADDDIRVIVLSGAGDKAFVAGADVSRFADERGSAEAIERYGRTTASATEALLASAKPTIAQIRGFCIGGGVGIAGCCDLRIAADDAQFAIPAARLGLGYAYDNMRNLVALVGPAAAKELFFTARRFSADEAFAMGLVNRVVPVEALQATVDEVTGMIADNAPLTVAAAKRTIGEIVKDPDQRDVEACRRMVQACFDSDDYIEGRTAFMEKRKPVFKGR